LDSKDEKSVSDFVGKLDRVDISFNGAGIDGEQGKALSDMTLENFMYPILSAMQSNFVTMKVISNKMKQKGAGVIMSITATPARKAYSFVGGNGPAWSAIESLSRDLASELGPLGIRVVNIRSGGSPDSRPFVSALGGETDLSKTFMKQMLDETMLKKLPMMVDIGNVAVFLASDMSRAITASSLNVTCGTAMD
ncbi:MAG TPA: SDR family oxidoreductase, partial [Cyclobacteriaceae bacterium]